MFMLKQNEANTIYLKKLLLVILTKKYPDRTKTFRDVNKFTYSY
jgi:hypothetical protein